MNDLFMYFHMRDLIESVWMYDLISSLLISLEMFGFEGAPFYFVAIAISYMQSGYYGLYRSQKIMYSKVKTQFINRNAKE